MSWFDKWRRKTVEDAIEDATEIIEDKVKESVDILPALLSLLPVVLIFASGVSTEVPKKGFSIKVDNVNLYL